MGGKSSQPSSTTTTIVQPSTSTTERQPTAAELELQQLELARRKASQPELLQLDQQLFSLLEPLTRGAPAGGMFSEIGQGISPETQQRIVDQTFRLTTPKFESLGLLDSGVRAELQTKLVADLLTQSEIAKQSQLQSLLGFISGAPGQAQQPIIDETSLLMQGLSSLGRTTSTMGGSTTTSQTFGGSSRRPFFGLF